jgi:hypothetical protein
MSVFFGQPGIYMINRACASAQATSLNVHKKLYEAKIFSILTYGSAIWGSPLDNMSKVILH